MKLLIDLGNSRMKWAEMGEDGLGGYGCCSYRERDDWPAALDGVADPEAIYFASVASDELNAQLHTYLLRKWGVRALRLFSQQACCGVHNGYAEPCRIGIDRWAAMVAAYQLHRGPLCVVDCGSAMTVDVLDRNGEHLGGLIAPGLRLQQSALQQGTASIGQEEEEVDTGQAWGRSTMSCIRLGAIHAMAALIGYSAGKLACQLQEPVKIVMTGGDAPLLLPLLDRTVAYEEHLVLEGMSLMVRQREA